eukprot:32568-Eustigmatos_ZCMA.PRE.1
MQETIQQHVGTHCHDRVMTVIPDKRIPASEAQKLSLTSRNGCYQCALDNAAEALQSHHQVRPHRFTRNHVLTKSTCYFIPDD